MVDFDGTLRVHSVTSRKETTPMPNAIAYLDESTAAVWERTLYAFLAEKERRSGSLRG